MAKPQQRSTPPTEAEKLLGRAKAAKAGSDHAREEVARCEAKMEELKKSLGALPEGHEDRAPLEEQLAKMEDETLPEAREALEAAEEEATKAVNELEAAGKAAGAQPSSPPAAPPPAAQAQSKAPKAGAAVRVRWMLNGVGLLTSPAIVKTVRDAQKGLLDVTITHGERLINLESVPPAWRDDLAPCWMQ